MSRISSKLKGLSLDRLETLTRIVAEGGIALAAGGDPNRQSQFSRQLAELEGWFGLPLLDRSTTPNRPTAEALRIAASTEAFLRELDGIREAAGAGRRTVVFGAGERMLRSYLIPWAGRLPQDGLRFIFRNLSSRSIRAELVGNRVDIGIVRRTDCPPGFSKCELPPLPMRLLLPEGLACRRRKWTWRELAGLPLVVLEGQGGFARFIGEQAMNAGVSLDLAVECSTWTQVIDAMRECKLAGFLPQNLERQFPDGFSVATMPCLADYADEYVIAWSASEAAKRSEIGMLTLQLGKPARDRIGP